jgi:hypothetical protein
MKKTRKTSSRRRKPAAKKRSWAASLLFFTFGIILAFLVLSFYPRLIPDQLQSTIRHSTIRVKQWQQKVWPSRTRTTTVKRQSPPAPKKTTARPAVKKSAPTTLYVTLYKATPDYDALTSSSKLLKLPKAGKVQLARLIFAELTRDGKKAKSPLPPGVSLCTATFAGRRITLDLSKEIISGMANTGSSDEMLAVYGLVNTYLKNFPDFSEVQITVAGHPVKTLAGHIEINKPLTFFEG